MLIKIYRCSKLCLQIASFGSWMRRGMGNARNILNQLSFLLLKYMSTFWKSGSYKDYISYFQSKYNLYHLWVLLVKSDIWKKITWVNILDYFRDVQFLLYADNGIILAVKKIIAFK